MSYPWILVRGASSNPSSLKFQALMNKQSIAENEIFKPERPQPQIIAAHMEDMVLVQDPFTFRKLRTKTQKYYAPFEPDGRYLKYWCRFNHIARKMKDHAFMGNYTYPHGYPRLCEGPDDGVKGGRIMSRLNTNPDIRDYYTTPSNSGLLSTVSGGFSVYLEFIADSIFAADEDFTCTLHYKYDDSNNLRAVILGESGELIFWVKKAGTDFSFQSPDNAITTNKLYRCCFTFNPNDNSQQMRINNIPQTDSGDRTFTVSTATTDVVHGRRGALDGGYFQGKLLDSRFYNLVFNGGHMDNIWYNARSICAATSIEFDGVDDKMGCGNHSDLWSQTLTKFSFGLWFFSDINTGFHTLVNHGAGSSGSFQLITNNLDIAFKINFGAGDTNVFGPFLHGRWNHILCVYDSTLGSNQQKVYLNGVIIAQGESGHGTINLSQVLELGDDFDGNVRDFRFWGPNKALTATEVIKVRDNRSDAPTPNYWLKMVEGNGFPVDWITRTKTTTFVNNTGWEMHISHRPSEYGSLAVAGYTRFNDTEDAGGYDTVGYDDTGFDTT